MKKTITTIIIACATAVTSQATLIVDEPFDYPTGSFNLSGQNGGTGFNGAWGTTAGNWSVTDGTITRTGDNLGQYRDLAAPLTGTFYASVDLRETGDGNDTFGNSLVFRDGTGGAGSTIFLFGLRNNQYRVFIGGSQQLAGTYNEGDWDQLVVRFEFNDSGDESVTLWVNPTTEGDTPVISDFTGEAGTSSFLSISPQAFELNVGTLAQDNIRIGTTFQDVIPEPNQAMSFGVVALLVMLWLRRQRCQ